MCGITKTIGKSSYLEMETTMYIKRIIAMLFSICVAGAIATTVWNSYIKIDAIWYLGWSSLSPAGNHHYHHYHYYSYNYLPYQGFFFVKFFYYFLLHSQFVPVSLYVSMYLIRGNIIIIIIICYLVMIIIITSISNLFYE